MEIRRTRSSDLPLLHDIFSRSIGELYRSHGFDPPAPPLTVFAAQQNHLLAHDGDLCAVAELDGAVAGFAAAWVRGRDWFLASLFVEPSRQGAGVGAALLDAVWGGEPLRRRTITDAIQPVSNVLYARRGLVPTTPVLAFVGIPARVAPPPELEAAAPTAAALRALDLAAYGFDRALDHAYRAAVSDCTLWLRAGRAVAYAYRFPDGTIGPIAGASGLDAGDALVAELARTRDAVRVRMPGTAREVVAAALGADLRLGPTPGFLLLGPGVEPPAALAIASYPLF